MITSMVLAAIFNAKDVGRTGPRAQQNDALFCESLYFTLVRFIILQNCVF